MSEADRVREELHDDPFVSNADYGRLVEEAADADERREWEAEKPPISELLDGYFADVKAHAESRLRRR